MFSLELGWNSRKCRASNNESWPRDMTTFIEKKLNEEDALTKAISAKLLLSRPVALHYLRETAFDSWKDECARLSKTLLETLLLF
jgi:hypothetical protein